MSTIEIIGVSLTLIALLILAAIFMIWSQSRINRQAADFDAKFPPISDKEFLALCKPGTNPEIALKVRRIVSDSLGMEYERIHPSASLVEDLDCC